MHSSFRKAIAHAVKWSWRWLTVRGIDGFNCPWRFHITGNVAETLQIGRSTWMNIQEDGILQ